jgi:hypothetical protein
MHTGALAHPKSQVGAQEKVEAERDEGKAHVGAHDAITSNCKKVAEEVLLQGDTTAQRQRRGFALASEAKPPAETAGKQQSSTFLTDRPA